MIKPEKKEERQERGRDGCSAGKGKRTAWNHVEWWPAAEGVDTPQGMMKILVQVYIIH